MTKEEVCQLFMAGIDCSQALTGEYANSPYYPLLNGT